LQAIPGIETGVATIVGAANPKSPTYGLPTGRSAHGATAVVTASTSGSSIFLVVALAAAALLMFKK